MKRFTFTFNRVFPLIEARGGIPCESENPDEEEEEENGMRTEYAEFSEDELWDEEVETGESLEGGGGVREEVGV